VAHPKGNFRIYEPDGTVRVLESVEALKKYFHDNGISPSPAWGWEASF
jgi:hypothetical protein